MLKSDCIRSQRQVAPTLAYNFRLRVYHPLHLRDVDYGARSLEIDKVFFLQGDLYHILLMGSVYSLS